MRDEIPDLSDYSGFAYRAAHICTGCFAKAFESGELVTCDSCDHWTIPNDPHAGVVSGHMRFPCVTDNHATPFDKHMETAYAESCDRCGGRIETKHLAEFFQGTHELDWWLTRMYRAVINRRSGNAESLKCFGELVDVWLNDPSKDDAYISDVVQRWLQGKSRVSEKALTDLLDKVRAAI